MIHDSRLAFSAAQALTATAVSTNVIDLSQALRNVGPGKPVWVIVTIDVAADDASANETYVAELQTDTVEGFASPTQLATVTIPRGSAAGAVFVMQVPQTNERYLRCNYTLGGTTPSVTLSAHLSDQIPYAHVAYPDSIPALGS